MLDEWVGREEQADDEVSLAGARRMAALLDRSGDGLARGVAVPAHWYVMLFNPLSPQSGLGLDGHPEKGQFLPPVPLPRRMFAGRRAWFHRPLIVGETVTRTSRIQSITPKQGRSGEMCFVTVRNEITSPAGLAIVEEQDIVYRANPSGKAPPPARAEAVDTEVAQWSQAFEPDATLVFRYSAITFNAHRIHYDMAYAREAEGYPALVVNGGLTTLMLWELAVARCGRPIVSSSTRNLKALFVGQPAVLAGRMDAAGRVQAWALDGAGERAIEMTLELADQ